MLSKLLKQSTKLKPEYFYWLGYNPNGKYTFRMSDKGWEDSREIFLEVGDSAIEAVKKVLLKLR